MSDALRRGERVKHATKTEWGIGEVLTDELGGRVQIFFEDVGAKEFASGRATFLRLSGEDAISDYLTALVKHHRAESLKPVRIKGKKDPEFVPFNKLQQSEFGEIAARAKRVVGETNLISPYEKMWLSEALGSTENRALFGKALHDLLYGAGGGELRFQHYSQTLTAIGAAKWPIATYFPFITFPDEHMFVKPVVTQQAANVLGQELNYRPELNWLTYSLVLALAQRIRKELLKQSTANLKPRDMVDVQSFIWVTAPGYFQ